MGNFKALPALPKISPSLRKPPSHKGKGKKNGKWGLFKIERRNFPKKKGQGQGPRPNSGAEGPIPLGPGFWGKIWAPGFSTKSQKSPKERAKPISQKREGPSQKKGIGEEIGGELKGAQGLG